jgi:polygalacturonase
MSKRTSIVTLFLIGAANLYAQDQRRVTEPIIPPVCASLAAVDSWPLHENFSDTARIQAALDRCASGRAVEPKASGTNDSFLAGALDLRRGITLLIDSGVTWYASRDPKDFEITPGSCGVITAKGHGCRALLNGDNVANAGVMGDGVIDGRGGEKILGRDVTWWQLADQARAGGSQNNPRLVELKSCNTFTLYRITLRNSPNFHVFFRDSDGFTAWAVKIRAPKRARNTDGIDPANCTNVTITESWIDTGDDNVAIKAGSGRPSTHITVAHNHFYSGHGMSIGSETDAGASAIQVSDLTIEGADNGIRIKSNASRGGLVHDIVYDDVCIRDTRNALLFDTHYTPLGTATNLIPRFEDITLRNVRIEGESKLTFDGFDAAHPLGIAFDHISLSDPAHAELIAKWPKRNIDKAAFTAPDSPSACATRFQPFPAPTTPIRISADGSADFTTVQAAVDAATPGATLLLAPATYREKIVINTPRLTFRGAGLRPSDTVIVLDQSAGSTGSTFRSATVEVRAADFHASNITFANDFNRTHEQVSQGSQALALFVNGDRGVFRHVRLLGNQDTLYAASANCNPDGNPCIPTRQYFADCYIAGNVDFIFGDGKAFFDRCEIHSTPHSGGYITAQGKHYADEDSGFVFLNCTLTADPRAGNVWLGRPWRPFASVVFVDTALGPHIAPQGWREWTPGKTTYLDTTYYAESGSRGPNNDPQLRDPHTHLLSPAEAAGYSPAAFLAGTDHWNAEATP